MIISDQVRLVPSPADTVYDVRSAQLFSSRFLDLLQDSEVFDCWHHALPAANIFFSYRVKVYGMYKYVIC